MRANAKEAMVQQGDRMRKYAQERVQGIMQTPIGVKNENINITFSHRVFSLGSFLQSTG